MECSSWVLSPQGRTRECSPKLEWLPLRPAPHTCRRAHTHTPPRKANKISHHIFEKSTSHSSQTISLGEDHFHTEWISWMKAFREEDKGVIINKETSMQEGCCYSENICYLSGRYRYEQGYSVNEGAACSQRRKNIWRHSSCGRILRGPCLNRLVSATARTDGRTYVRWSA
jgi:hypothetical protein